MKSEYNFDDLNFNPIIHGAIIPPMRIITKCRIIPSPIGNS